ncbi:MAG: hypothetical protein GXO83_10090 [Chlorobi bacterium]|nr:hypothetical protein [Chlorobiota bacterium]
MEISVKPVRSHRELRKFIYLPARIHRNHDTWLPPIYMDEWEFFNPKKNKSFGYCDTILLLAWKNGKAVGRIMGIINKRYNEIHHENHARFIFMECYHDREVFHALISAVEDWAREKGMVKVIGPLGFSDKDPQGFQINGFEYQTILATVGNYPYMVDLLEKEGYTKKVDLRDYLIDIPSELPELYKRVYRRVSHRADFEIIEFENRKQLKPYIIPVLQLMNDTYSVIYGFVPLTEKEMIELAKRYLPVLDPHFVKVVKVADEIVGFVIGMPDISEGLKKSHGHLFPFGIFHILRTMKKATHLTLLLGAIKPDFRNFGVDVMMGIKMMETASARNIKTIESHLILEHNHRMNGEVEKVGGKIIKRFRIFQKDLV